jgi:16S rRNA (adenine1518-N6/adenine1519-N6)-dimethyltransferase
VTRPKRSLGQNFLTDPNIQRKIVESLELRPGDTLVEIGPGRGALTDRLALRAERLVAVELDDQLADMLAERFAEEAHVEIVHRDFLTFDLHDLSVPAERLVVVGNIPYNITAPILFKLLDHPRPREILLMVQREVADRIVSAPGTAAYGALAVGVQTVADAEVVMRVPRGAFRPVPKVDSAVVRIRPHAPPHLSPEEEDRIRSVTRALFQWRRKQLQRTLRSHPDLGLSPDQVRYVGQETGWDLTRRPETLTPLDVASLTRAIARSRSR